jgi:signal transduction histidine kinase
VSGSSSPSIGRKITWLSTLSSAAGLLVASLALIFYDLHDARLAMIQRLQTISAMLAFNSASALDFNDADAAGAVLASLKTRPSVVAAGILVNRKLFAKYLRDGKQPPAMANVLDSYGGYRFTGDYLFVFQPITLEARALGTLYVQSDLLEIDQRLRRYVVIISAFAVGAVLLTMLISRRLQSGVSGPILELAALAQTVSDRRDYSVRAPEVRSAAEVEQLVSTFNQMLVEIQRQHAELEESQSMLEQRVEARTRELAAANKELEAFSYSVSHDLRAPLRAIDGFSKALITNYTDKPLDQQGRHFLERVRAGTQKMSGLIDDMLHLARVTRSTLQRKDVDVTAVAKEVATELARRNPDRQVQCRIEGGLRAFADSHLLSIVFENLLGNAWKFTAQKDAACVEVGKQNTGQDSVFYVRDNGAGFDMAYADKLFGAFQRLHDDSEFEGTGIGLATVQRIINSHGGRIWAEAEEQKGAVFYFTLGGSS